MRRIAAVLSLVVPATLLPLGTTATAQTEVPPVAKREVEPVVLTGRQIPQWSQLAAEGRGDTYPSGTGGDFTPPGAENVRDAHNGEFIVPENDPRTGVDVDNLVAYAYRGGRFVEIPVQVDERFPYFLANSNSDFAFYSGTDRELSYEWDVESWLKTAGECAARYPNGVSRVDDPVHGLDDDDEIVFMASDGGEQAPSSSGPWATTDERQEIQIVDPLTGDVSFVYLFLRPGGSSFDETNGYVSYQRDVNADEWIDRNTFTRDDPEKLGSSNTGYGPNLDGTVCTDDPSTPEVETLRTTQDRFPRDGVTVSTNAYEWRATGRWMIRAMKIRKGDGSLGPDLIDRWKGRAFQQSPDSSISVVGFEDEQVNWEANSALLGERLGPVRAIREIWGADSGTNVTKTETFYRNAVTYRYRVRVHPIPPDGLYTSWDYNRGIATRYYNEMLVQKGQVEGVPIDGVNDDVGNVDSVEGAPCPKDDIGENPVTEDIPCLGDGAYFDAPDPTFTKPLSFFNWEQVSGAGDHGSLVYMFENKSAQSLENPLVTPYYRDDACLDDGTGDDPVQRPFPGESYAWLRDPGNDAGNASEYPDLSCYRRQGAYGSHGVHYFITHDTDNATVSSAAVTEIDGQQWQWAVPTTAPAPVGDRYANTVKAPLQVVAASQANSATKDPAVVTIEGPDGGQTTDEATAIALLVDGDGRPMDGRAVNFSLDGQDLGDATTGADGRASKTFTVTGDARESMLTARFAGDERYVATSDVGPFEVRHEDTVLVLDDPAAVQSSDHVSLTATLTEDGNPVSGRTIEFSIEDGSVGSGVTDDDGVATITVAVDEVPGDYLVSASFGGDKTFLADRDTSTLIVAIEDTSVALEDPAAVQTTDDSTLSARLTEDGNALAGRTITFSVAGDEVGSGVTGENGWATTTFTVDDAPGSHAVVAAFAGDDRFAGSTDSSSLAVEQEETSLDLDDPGSVQTTDEATLSALLTEDGEPIEGRPVSFTVGGRAVGTAITNENGIATTSFVATEAPGDHDVVAIFEGDSIYAGSEDSATLAVTWEATAIDLVDPGSVQTTDEATLGARLTEDGAPLAGRTITFTFDHDPVGSGITDADGVATATFTVDVDPGDYPVGAAFAANERFEGSEDSSTLPVALEATTLTLDDPTAVQTTDKGTLTARLTEDGNPLAGRVVRFTVGGRAIASALTEDDGVATISFTTTELPGSYEVEATFLGNRRLEASDDASTLSVLHDDSRLTVRLKRTKSGIRAIATLVDADSTAPLPGRTVMISLNGGRPVKATTSESGEAKVLFRTKSKKKMSARATFAGDDRYFPYEAGSSIDRARRR